MTLFAAAMKITGLSQRELCDIMDVRIDTVKGWCSGRNNPPNGAWDVLRGVYAMQVKSSEEALDLIDEKSPTQLSLNEFGPRGKEWPSEGAHKAALAMVALAVDIQIAKTES